MKKINVLQLIMFLAISMSFFSCSKDELDEYYDGVYAEYGHAGLTKYSYFQSFICFEDSTGQNILTSSDAPADSVLSISQDTIDWLDIKCTRGSDNADLTSTLSFALANTKEGVYNAFGDEVPIGGNGPVLCLNWIDMDLRSGIYRQGTYDETYTLTIKSTRMKTKPIHTIKWTIRVLESGDADDDIFYWAKACEVDGKKYPLDNDNSWCYWVCYGKDGENTKVATRRKVIDFFHFKDE